LRIFLGYYRVAYLLLLPLPNLDTIGQVLHGSRGGLGGEVAALVVEDPKDGHVGHQVTTEIEFCYNCSFFLLQWYKIVAMRFSARVYDEIGFSTIVVCTIVENYCHQVSNKIKFLV
jgi:hypothetical protein